LLIVVGIATVVNTIISYSPHDIDAAAATRIGFLIYIVGIAILTLNDSIELMNEGKDAQNIRMEAQTDIMTKLRNRAAYEQDMSDIPASEYKNYGVVMCDLNNLKMFNDLHGHSMGDYYIITCAQVIKETYQKYGTAYRIGGDEFCVVVKDMDDATEEQLRDEMHEKTESMSLEGQKFALHLEIASGYAKFDPDQDKDLSDTVERADQIMYEHKSGMKHRGSE
jgi:diguanylate cyclase (GGDEF)-like protein